jgi:hypothetical protein
MFKFIGVAIGLFLGYNETTIVLAFCTGIGGTIGAVIDRAISGNDHHRIFNDSKPSNVVLVGFSLFIIFMCFAVFVCWMLVGFHPIAQDKKGTTQLSVQEKSTARTQAKLPAHIVLRRSVEFPAIMNGKVVGKVTVPSGEVARKAEPKGAVF